MAIPVCECCFVFPFVQLNRVTMDRSCSIQLSTKVVDDSGTVIIDFAISKLCSLHGPLETG
jgi:hypothetical protein